MGNVFNNDSNLQQNVHSGNLSGKICISFAGDKVLEIGRSFK